MAKFSLEYLRDLPLVDLGEIILRPVLLEDYRDMFKYGSDDLVTKTLMWDSYKNIDEAKESVIKVFLSRPERGIPSAYAIVYKESMQMIGTCDIFLVNWEKLTGEIGYVLHRDFWGRGYMTLACKALLDLGFNYLNLNKIDIGHMAGNVGSRRVIEKCGFRFVKEGKHSRLDIIGREYEMTKEEYHKLKLKIN